MDATAPMGFLRLAPRRNQHKRMVKPGTCRECGTAYIARRATRAFCCAACRRAFNHRRLLRGADFYDLFMAMRCDRGNAADEGAWTLLCKMAAAFKSEDDASVTVANLGTTLRWCAHAIITSNIWSSKVTSAALATAASCARFADEDRRATFLDL
jgi:hypothetical protein